MAHRGTANVFSISDLCSEELLTGATFSIFIFKHAYPFTCPSRRYRGTFHVRFCLGINYHQINLTLS